jgi:hypothetical protein
MQDAEFQFPSTAASPTQQVGQLFSSDIKSVEVIQQTTQEDEISKLQTDVSAIMSERDATHDALDKMLLDLLSCKQELEEKSNELAMKNSEIQELRANLSNKELLLAGTVAETETHLMHAQQEVPAVRIGETVMKSDVRTLELHQEVSRLTVELEETQKELMKKELSWQEKLGDTEKDYQLKLAKTNEQHQADIAKLKELTAQLVADERRRGDEAEARVQQLDTTSNAASLEELRRMCNFFKKNSEQLSKQNREILSVNRNLQESLRVNSQQKNTPRDSDQVGLYRM